MNNDCRGDFFTAKRTKFYQCFWDGAVLSGVKNRDECPNCKRQIDGREHGRLAVHTQEFVLLEHGPKVMLPSQDEEGK